MTIISEAPYRVTPGKMAVLNVNVVIVMVIPEMRVKIMQSLEPRSRASEDPTQKQTKIIVHDVAGLKAPRTGNSDNAILGVTGCLGRAESGTIAFEARSEA